MSTDRIELFVPLRNEGTDVLRPTTGVFVAPDAVRVVAAADYDPELEEWEFPSGSEVRCLAEFRGGRRILVRAVSGARSVASGLTNGKGRLDDADRQRRS